MAQVLSLTPNRPAGSSSGAVTAYGSLPSVQSRRVSAARARGAWAASGASSVGHDEHRVLSGGQHQQGEPLGLGARAGNR